MEYEMIRFPINIRMNASIYRQFKLLSISEAKGYFKWFVEQIPLRVSLLGEYVRKSPGFEDWTPDHTPASLEPLGRWFCAQVSTRKRSSDEMAKLREGHPAWVHDFVLDWDLADLTYSICVDVGITCVVASKIAEGKDGPMEFRRLYGNWSRMAFARAQAQAKT